MNGPIRAHWQFCRECSQIQCNSSDNRNVRSIIVDQDSSNINIANQGSSYSNAKTFRSLVGNINSAWRDNTIDELSVIRVGYVNASSISSNQLTVNSANEIIVYRASGGKPSHREERIGEC